MGLNYKVRRIKDPFFILIYKILNLKIELLIVLVMIVVLLATLHLLMNNSLSMIKLYSKIFNLIIMK